MHRLLPFWVILISLFFSSCNEESQIQTDLEVGETFDIFIVDTISLRTSSIVYDSIPSPEFGRMLIGFHDDEQFGTISSSAFFQLTPDESYELDEENSQYDSVTMVLKLDGYSYYDTLNPSTYFVFQIKEDLDQTEEYYNTSSIDHSETSLAVVSVTPRPRKDSTVEISLNDGIGLELFQLATEGSETIQNDEEFLKNYKGFCVIPDSTNGAILGYSDAYIIVYYQDRSVVPAMQRQLQISHNGGAKFNRVLADRSKTSLAGLQNFEEALSSDSTDQNTFIQGGIGISTRIEAPFLRELLKLNDDFVLSRAQLNIYPLQKSFSKLQPLPASLIVQYVDDDNNPISSTQYQIDLLEDPYDPLEVYYQFDMTEFVNFQMLIEENNENALLITPTSEQINNSVDRAVIGDGTSSLGLKLSLYYITI